MVSAQPYRLQYLVYTGLHWSEHGWIDESSFE